MATYRVESSFPSGGRLILNVTPIGDASGGTNQIVARPSLSRRSGTGFDFPLQEYATVYLSESDFARLCDFVKHPPVHVAYQRVPAAASLGHLCHFASYA